MKFEDLVKVIDAYTKIELYEFNGEKLLFTGAIKDLKNHPDRVMSIVPQKTSREVYLEIKVY